MIDLNRTTAEIVAEIRGAAEARGTETEASERWEGDGVWLIWRADRHGEGTHDLRVAGTDTQYEPGIEAGRGLGEEHERGTIKTMADAVAWLDGRG
jgi:hypothetical protein